MKALVVGAFLGVLWLLLGWPLAVPTVVVSTVAQPTVMAFAAGLLARPYLARRWTA